MNRIIYIIFTILILGAFCNRSYAQGVGYNYDNNGNRIQSMLVSPPLVIKNKPNSNTKDTVNANELAASNGLKVYPNPTQYSVSVAIDSLPASNNTTIIYLLDVNGAILYTNRVTEWPYPIPMASYAAGTYFVKVVIGTQKPLFYRVLKSK